MSTPPAEALSPGPESRSTFTVPESARGRAQDPRTLTISQLTVGMEIDADKAASAAGGGDKNIRREFIKRAVVAVDGKAVSWDRADPEWYDAASPKVRELAWYAYVKVNRTTNDEDKAFLDSEVVAA